MTISLDWLRTFETAARHGNFSAAARELNLTQPAVSQQIKALEHKIGGDLFVRETRGVTLTDLGDNMLFDISNSLEAIDNCLERFGQPDGRVLDIASNISFGEWWLAPRLHRFLEHQPDISINFTLTLWPNEFRKLAAGVEIRYGPQNPRDSNSSLLYDDELQPVCAPSICETIVDFEHLADQTLIEVPAIGDTWGYWAESLGVSLPTPRNVLRVNHQATALLLARGGGGIALGSRILSKGMLDSGQLQAPLPLRAKRRYCYWSILKDPANPAASAFHKWVIDESRSDRLA